MKLTQITQIVFFLFSLGYLASMFKGPFLGHWIIKAIPALTLAVMVGMNNPGLAGKLMLVGLIFSAGGDIALAFYRGSFETTVGGNGNLFIAGLALFLIAHVLYVIGFAQDFEYQSGRLPVVLIVLGLAVAMAIVLWPKLGEMLIPVLLYIVAISCMGIFSGMNSKGGWILIIGAILFMLSDSMIAINKFMFSGELKWAPFFVMITYYSAQYLISKPYWEAD